MEKMIQGLYDEMKANKNLAQPADGDMYWASLPAVSKYLTDNALR
jgi:hypothetical protein